MQSDHSLSANQQYAYIYMQCDHSLETCRAMVFLIKVYSFTVLKKIPKQYFSAMHLVLKGQKKEIHMGEARMLQFHRIFTAHSLFIFPNVIALVVVIETCTHLACRVLSSCGVHWDACKR